MNSMIAILLVCVSAAQASKLYLGCWADADDLRAFSDDNVIWLQGDDNYRTCADYCRNLGFQFAGIQKGDECRCANGNSWTMYGTRPDEKCEDPCPDGTKRCGGNFRNAVYSTKLYYIGCVDDTVDSYYDYPQNHVLSVKLYSDYWNNPLRCVTECTDGGYWWAGVREATECWCGYQNDIYKVIDWTKDLTEDKCNKPCPESPQTCGGTNAISVYHIYCKPHYM